MLSPPVLLVAVSALLLAMLLYASSVAPSGPSPQYLAARGPNCNVKKSAGYTLRGEAEASLQYQDPAWSEELSVREQAQWMARIAACEAMKAKANADDFDSDCVENCLKKRAREKKGANARQECEKECKAKLVCPAGCDADPSGKVCTTKALCELRRHPKTGKIRGANFGSATCTIVRDQSYWDHTQEPPVYVVRARCTAAAKCTVQCFSPSADPSPSGGSESPSPSGF